MKSDMLRRSCVCTVLLIAMIWSVDGMSADQRRSTANVTFPDGTSQVVTLNGVGCTVSICSRTFVRGRSNGSSIATISFDALARITDVTEDSGLFVMKDGAQQRLSFIPDFRVLHLGSGTGKAGKLDLAKIRSLQMLPLAK